VKEPYETLLGQYRDHWFMWPFLEGDIPDFWPMVQNHAFDALSTGEQVMVMVALALWNGDGTARIADLAKVDPENRRRILDALFLALAA
jgi:hypothetical protein